VNGLRIERRDGHGTPNIGSVVGHLRSGQSASGNTAINAHLILSNLQQVALPLMGRID